METMERIAVRSRDIAIVGYDPVASKLEITFRNGGVYRYSSVPEEIYKGLMTAPSQGKFFDHNIKHRYHYLRIR